VRILVVGAGAIGGYFGARLLAAGRDVTFLVRERRAEQLRRSGLVVMSPLGNVNLPTPPLASAKELKDFYGLILVIVGLVGSHAVKTKAAGINVDLWTGLGMLVFAALMLFWAFRKPVMPEPPETRGEGSGRIRRAPAT